MQRISLEALARQQMKLAATAGGGHTADSVFGGHEKVLRQTVIGMRAGRSAGRAQQARRGPASRVRSSSNVPATPMRCSGHWHAAPVRAFGTARKRCRARG